MGMYFTEQAICASLQGSDASLKGIIFPSSEHFHTENVGGKLESKHLLIYILFFFFFQTSVVSKLKHPLSSMFLPSPLEVLFS